MELHFLLTWVKKGTVVSFMGSSEIQVTECGSLRRSLTQELEGWLEPCQSFPRLSSSWNMVKTHLSLYNLASHPLPRHAHVISTDIYIHPLLCGSCYITWVSSTFVPDACGDWIESQGLNSKFLWENFIGLFSVGYPPMPTCGPVIGQEVG